MKLFILNKMKDNIFFQKSKNENNHRNMSLNERYHKRNLTLIKTSNSKTLSTFSTLRKIEDLKKKYINMNFQQKKNLKSIFKKIKQLNNKYNSIESFKSKTLETEPNYKKGLDIYKTLSKFYNCSYIDKDINFIANMKKTIDVQNATKNDVLDFEELNKCLNEKIYENSKRNIFKEIGRAHV